MLRSLVNETINIDAFTTLRENGHFLSKKSQNAHKLNSTQNIKNVMDAVVKNVGRLITECQRKLHFIIINYFLIDLLTPWGRKTHLFQLIL